MRREGKFIYLRHPRSGLELHVAEWARRLGIPRKTLYSRIHLLGYDDERTLLQEARSNKRRAS